MLSVLSVLSVLSLLSPQQVQGRELAVVHRVVVQHQADRAAAFDARGKLDRHARKDVAALLFARQALLLAPVHVDRANSGSALCAVAPRLRDRAVKPRSSSGSGVIALRRSWSASPRPQRRDRARQALESTGAFVQRAKGVKTRQVVRDNG